MTTETRPEVAALLAGAVRRALGETVAAVEDLGSEELHAVVHPQANTVGWVAWHVFRTADVIGARIRDESELWVRRGLAEAWDLPPEGNGSGQSTAEAQALRLPAAEALARYGRELRDELAEAAGALDEAGLTRRVPAFGGREFTASDALQTFVVLHTVRHQGEINVTRALIAGVARGGPA